MYELVSSIAERQSLSYDVTLELGLLQSIEILQRLYENNHVQPVLLLAKIDKDFKAAGDKAESSKMNPSFGLEGQVWPSNACYWHDEVL